MTGPRVDELFRHLQNLSQKRRACADETPSQNTNAILFQSRLRNGAYWEIVTDILDAYDVINEQDGQSWHSETA